MSAGLSVRMTQTSIFHTAVESWHGMAYAHSCVWLFVTPWTVHPTSLLYPWDFSWQEHWSGLPFPSPGDLPNPGIDPESLMSPASADGFFTTSTTWEACYWPIKGEQRPPGKQRHSYQARYLRSDCLEVGNKSQIKFINTHRQSRVGKGKWNKMLLCGSTTPPFIGWLEISYLFFSWFLLNSLERMPIVCIYLITKEKVL